MTKTDQSCIAQRQIDNGVKRKRLRLKLSIAGLPTCLIHQKKPDLVPKKPEKTDSSHKAHI